MRCIIKDNKIPRIVRITVWKYIRKLKRQYMMHLLPFRIDTKSFSEKSRI